ncbi:MAG: hypothetical protein NVS2B16_12740 [Chloroflexota bacterium]
MLCVEFLENIGLQFRVTMHRRDNFLSFIMRSGLDKVGNLSWVEALETREGDAELC